MLDSQAPRRTARENTCVPAEVTQALARAHTPPGVIEAAVAPPLRRLSGSAPQ